MASFFGDEQIPVTQCSIVHAGRQIVVHSDTPAEVNNGFNTYAFKPRVIIPKRDFLHAAIGTGIDARAVVRFEDSAKVRTCSASPVYRFPRGSYAVIEEPYVELNPW